MGHNGEHIRSNSNETENGKEGVNALKELRARYIDVLDPGVAEGAKRLRHQSKEGPGSE
jgi:hypothetical protein